MKKAIGILLIAVTLVSCNQKTGFVDTEKLVKEYKEMTDAQDKYSKLNETMMNDLDVKIKEYQVKVDLYQKNGSSMTASERQQKEEEIMALRQQLQQEQQTRGRKLQEESQSAIDSIIKKVKDKVEAYGEENGYDYIYGKNEAGSVLYGKASLDLTDEVLKELNAAYQGNSSNTEQSEVSSQEKSQDTTN